MGLGTLDGTMSRRRDHPAIHRKERWLILVMIRFLMGVGIYLFDIMRIPKIEGVHYGCITW